MIRVLVNDGIHPEGQRMMEDAGFEVINSKIEQDELVNHLNNFDAICVRSATKVRQDLIAQCPNLKVIARGGVGLDNIDVDYALSKGIKVINTPAASSRSVAELAFAHMLSCARFLYDANKKMPSEGNSNFDTLKKAYAKGCELEGKTLGVIGMGRIGQEAIKIGIGLGMKILAHDPLINEVSVRIGSQEFNTSAKILSCDKIELLKNSDFITLHIPYTGAPALNQVDFDKMKDGVIIANCARGGVINEDALLSALKSGKVSCVGNDVFINEPTPRTDLLNHPHTSNTPHIGAATKEAQVKVGTDLAKQVIEAFNPEY